VAAIAVRPHFHKALRLLSTGNQHAGLPTQRFRIRHGITDCGPPVFHAITWTCSAPWEAARKRTQPVGEPGQAIPSPPRRVKADGDVNAEACAPQPSGQDLRPCTLARRRNPGSRTRGPMTAGRCAGRRGRPNEAKPHLGRGRDSTLSRQIAQIEASSDVRRSSRRTQAVLLTIPANGRACRSTTTIRCAGVDLQSRRPRQRAPAHDQCRRKRYCRRPAATPTSRASAGGDGGDHDTDSAGTGNDHGNERNEPVVLWIDTLDWPICEFPRLHLARRGRPQGTGDRRTPRPTCPIPEDHPRAPAASKPLRQRRDAAHVRRANNSGIGRGTAPYVNFRGQGTRKSAPRSTTEEPAQGRTPTRACRSRGRNPANARRCLPR